MTDQDLKNFADNYSRADFTKIRYDWNGRLGDDFHDGNYEFRIQLCQFLIPQLANTNIKLIRDLFVEEAKASKVTFGIYMNIHHFAQELLKRDWKKYLIDYMEAGTHGMDAYFGIGKIEIDNALAQEIFDHINVTLKESENENEKTLMSGYLERFKWLASKQE
ncbi:MAG: hypothetical protein KDC92_14760 [Bacteroidetes bacterium]|nr:hypothetical protein [Bacteroidota bacterium]